MRNKELRTIHLIRLLPHLHSQKLIKSHSRPRPTPRRTRLIRNVRKLQTAQRLRRNRHTSLHKPSHTSKGQGPICLHLRSHTRNSIPLKTYPSLTLKPRRHLTRFHSLKIKNLNIIKRKRTINVMGPHFHTRNIRGTLHLRNRRTQMKSFTRQTVRRRSTQQIYKRQHYRPDKIQPLGNINDGIKGLNFLGRYIRPPNRPPHHPP